MEVGAVKQAFNNEVILLKKNLNQARTQIIHKLTRKAKTFSEKKAPEQLKEKFKKKAESAVNEVLILKKIKPRDIAEFAITHKGELKQHLNKPQVDKDKACAHLLLHKALQDKYKFLRGRFGDVPIQDLFMSRQERRKLKKDQKEEQKNKKKGKHKNVVNSEGDWNVEDIEIGEDLKDVNINDDVDTSNHDLNSESDMDHNEQQADSENEINQSNDEIEKSDEENEIQPSDDELRQVNDDDESVNEEPSVGMFVKLKQSNEVPLKEENKVKVNKKGDKLKQTNIMQHKEAVSNEENIKTPVTQKIKPVQDKTVNKKSKNKKLKEKLQTRKPKKDISEDLFNENKVVDPFFITSTGENYLSVAEPRQPDKVKEIHKQGNRKERRAAMFGHVPRIKPRRDDSRQNFNSKFNKQSSVTNRNDNYKDDTNFKNKFNTFGHSKERFNDNSKSNGKNVKFNDNSSFNNSKFNKSDNKFNNNRSVEKDVKLHPSWEAKKKQSTIVPFQGKKIVFDES